MENLNLSQSLQHNEILNLPGSRNDYSNPQLQSTGSGPRQSMASQQIGVDERRVHQWVGWCAEGEQLVEEDAEGPAAT